MRCKLCNQERSLVRAHVIPEGFFRLLRNGNESPILLTNIEGEYQRRSPIGEYDTTILCEICEQRFGPWDDYAQQFLLQSFDEDLYILHNGTKVALKIPIFDYHKLKLFFESLLWRASVSTREFYKKVRTGPFEDQLRGRIISEEPGDAETFAVTLAKFEHGLGTAILDPHPDRPLNGINYMRFYLGGFIAYIKLDRRPAPDFLGQFKMSPNEPLIIILRDLTRSKELPLMRDIVERFK